MDIGMGISILAIAMTIINFFVSRKDKSNKDVGNQEYRTGRLEEKVDNISKQVNKVLDKLDSYDSEIDTRIEKAILNHEKAYHNQ